MENKINLTMPQLVPFYFINEITFTFLSLMVIIFLLSKYILPKVLRVHTSRLFISKL